MKYSAVIVAAGKGERFSDQENKLLVRLKNGKQVLEQTLDVFLADEQCAQIVVVLSREGLDDCRKRRRCGKIVYVLGGADRQTSVYNGLLAVNQAYVLIHDGARPWITQPVISRVLEALQKREAVIAAVAEVDTIKTVDADGVITGTIDRKTLRRAQTPQGFHFATLLAAYKQAMEHGLKTTDDAQLYQTVTAKPVWCVEGDPRNRKITTPEDME